MFKKFIRTHLNQQKKEYCCIEDFKDFPITSDIYCTGSDQTWNSGWNNGILPELFLKFVPGEVKKISYAASIGKARLDDWEVEETKALLSRYKYISVREASAKDIVEKQLGLKFVEISPDSLNCVMFLISKYDYDDEGFVAQKNICVYRRVRGVYGGCLGQLKDVNGNELARLGRIR